MTVNPNVTSAPETSLRERKKQQTWEAIHQAAVSLVAERGVGQVTIGDICAQAGVSERTFFNYFPSKAAAALGLPNTAVPAALAEVFVQGQASLIDDLCVLVSGLSTNAERIKAVKALIHDQPELVTSLHMWMGHLRASVIEVAEQRTTPERARAATSLVFTAMFLHADPGYPSLGDRPTSIQLRETVALLGAIANEH